MVLKAVGFFVSKKVSICSTFDAPKTFVWKSKLLLVFQKFVQQALLTNQFACVPGATHAYIFRLQPIFFRLTGSPLILIFGTAAMISELADALGLAAIRITPVNARAYIHTVSQMAGWAHGALPGRTHPS